MVKKYLINFGVFITAILISAIFFIIPGLQAKSAPLTAEELGIVYGEVTGGNSYLTLQEDIQCLIQKSIDIIAALIAIFFTVLFVFYRTKLVSIVFVVMAGFWLKKNFNDLYYPYEYDSELTRSLLLALFVPFLLMLVGWEGSKKASKQKLTAVLRIVSLTGLAIFLIVAFFSTAFLVIKCFIIRSF